MKKNYLIIQNQNLEDIFERNKSILLYLVYIIYSNINKSNDGQQKCEELDILKNDKFIDEINSTLYRSIHKIKIYLISIVNKKNTQNPKYNQEDIKDAVEIATIASCNSLLNFCKSFAKKK